MSVLLKNNAFATTVIAASSSDTALVLKAGTGANFPTITGGDYFYLTIANGSSAPEVVKCTAKSGDILTVVRAQEGTAAQAIPAGSIVELRVTAQSVIDAINDRVLEGTLTPTDQSGAGLTFSTALGRYTKVGRLVTFSMTVTYPSTANGSAAIISRPPFVNAEESPVTLMTNVGSALQGYVTSTGINLFPVGSFTPTTNATLSGKTLYISGVYMATS